MGLLLCALPWLSCCFGLLLFARELLFRVGLEECESPLANFQFFLNVGGHFQLIEHTAVLYEWGVF